MRAPNAQEAGRLLRPVPGISGTMSTTDASPPTEPQAQPPMNALSLVSLVRLRGERLPRGGRIWIAFACMGLMKSALPLAPPPRPSAPGAGVVDDHNLRHGAKVIGPGACRKGDLRSSVPPKPGAQLPA